MKYIKNFKIFESENDLESQEAVKRGHDLEKMIGKDLTGDLGMDIKDIFITTLTEEGSGDYIKSGDEYRGPFDKRNPESFKLQFDKVSKSLLMQKSNQMDFELKGEVKNLIMALCEYDYETEVYTSNASMEKWTELNTENPSGKVNAIKFILNVSENY